MSCTTSRRPRSSTSVRILAAIKKALGAQAGPKPTLRVRGEDEEPGAFTRATIELEDIAVAGYNGQATNLTQATLAAAATIVSVEARHAAWIRALAGEVAAPDAVDKPMTRAAGRSGSARDRGEGVAMDAPTSIGS